MSNALQIAMQDTMENTERNPVQRAALPEGFLNRMKDLLGEEFEDFTAAYEEPACQSLRINPLKGSGELLVEKTEFLSEKVPWAPGYYYPEDKRPGKHPYHEAGVYYIQEASAMLPAVYLDAQPGEIILDLCAAPGGKSTQIAGNMQGRGLLICNEIHPSRAKVLSENIERMGIQNALVVSCEPDLLAEYFKDYFDKILVDAPCSGEGMFRKNAEAAAQWSLDNIKMCAERQKNILESAASMLRTGGRMVYSTCTFAPEENEGSISAFLVKHPEFSMERFSTERFSVEKAGERPNPANCPGLAPGIKAYGEAEGLERAIRLWPHKIRGEGHFLASLVKQGESNGTSGLCDVEKGISEKECGAFLEFQKQYLRKTLTGVYVRFGEQLYLLPEGTPSLKGLKVLRPGLHLGTIKKNRFEPAHALALSLKQEEAVHVLNLSEEEAGIYLTGQTLSTAGEKGWYLITVDGYSLGWGKLSGGIMKNHYPKGLRK